MSEPLNLNQLAQKIKQWGLELGFQQVGITNTNLSESKPKLQAWLDKQYHSKMDWMAHHSMLHARPHELLPSTLHVISMQMNYLPANTTFASTLKNPKLSYVSHYALGHDYHKLLRNQLKKLGKMIQQHCVSLNFRPFVNSAPILKHPLAEKAGLSWTGKHSLILNHKASSFFFLGKLLVNIPLPMDQPVKEGYSKCMACMTICPTSAIIKPYTINARHCISYLTIKLEGAIPEELQPLMGNHIYSCNDCQLICPWNHYSQLTTEEDFSPRKPLHTPELIELFTWSKEKFLKVTEGSAIHHIGHLRWLHNITIALGNAPWDETILTALESHKGEHPLLNEHIAWAIAQQIERQNACIVKVQLPKKQHLVQVIEKGLPRDT